MPHRTLPGDLDIVGPCDQRLSLVDRPRHRLQQQRKPGVGGYRFELADRSGEPERCGGQAQLVGGKPAQALPVGGEPDAAGARHQLGELVVDLSLDGLDGLKSRVGRWSR